MSFSNADTGEIPPDPYKAKNLDEASIQDKVEGLSEFASACKFSMMTTRDGRTGDLVSRCMALAAKARLSLFNVSVQLKLSDPGIWWYRPHLSYKH